MVVKLRRMYSGGDEEKQLTIDEAQSMVQAEEGRYFVVDKETRKVIKPVEIVDGQELLMIPVLRGG